MEEPRCIGTAEASGLFERRGKVVDAGASGRVGAAGEQQLDSFEVVVGGGVVQRRSVVQPALAEVGAEPDQSAVGHAGS